MNTTKIGLIALMAMLVVLMAPAVFSVESISWTNPTSATAYLTIAATESQSMLNVTTAGNVNVTNCSFYFSASDTNQTAQQLLGTNSTTNNATLWTVKFNVSTLEDTNNGLLNASCESANRSVNVPFSAQQAVRIDGGHAPTAPTSVRPTNNYIASQDTTTVSFSGTVTAADATGCYIKFSGSNPGTSVYAKNNISAAATNCTVTIANFPEGAYKVQYFATDGTNDTVGNGAGNLFTVEYSTGSKGSLVYSQIAQPEEQQQAQSKKSTATTFILIIAAIVVITKVMKKGGRRR